MIPPGDPQLHKIGEPGGRGLILYDGVCVLCSGWVRFVASRDGERLFSVHANPERLWPGAGA
jgi:hypothetical protein